MDRWERRLQLLAHAGATGNTAARPGNGTSRPGVINARDRLLIPTGTDPVELIHPDESDLVKNLLDIADRRPDFHAIVTLLTRNGDRWEHHRFEVLHEVMGPVLRLMDTDPAGATPVDPDDDRPAVEPGLDPENPLMDGPEAQADSSSELATPGPATATADADSGATATGLSPGPIERGEVVRFVADALSRAGTGVVAVLLIDLDRFKIHNDELGPDGGDEMLRIMAERVATVAVGHFNGALGGDEFVVVLEHIDDPTPAQELAEALRAVLSDPVEIDGDLRLVSATVGLAVGSTDTLAEHLVRDADTALFAGKNRGRDRVQVFGRQLGERVAQQADTAHRLRRSLAQGTLEMHYQPIVSLDTQMVVGAEALMRVHGGRQGDGPLSPSSLVEAAEDNGLTARLGRYLLEETTSQIALWEHRLGPRRFRVSVNVAPVQLSNRDFSNAIAHALSATGISPQRLSLELTESILVATDPAVQEVVRELVDLGIAFGLDDFGSESSSLGDLRRYPLEFVKIDRDLVDNVETDPTVEAIIASTVSLARQLGVSTIAVGVERPGQAELLRRLGCDTAQGYLYSPPLDASAFGELLGGDDDGEPVRHTF